MDKKPRNLHILLAFCPVKVSKAKKCRFFTCLEIEERASQEN